MGVLIRRLESHEWPLYRAVRLRSLADSPGAFSQTLAAAEAILDAVWQARLIAAAQADLDYPLVAELDGEAVGMLWAKVDRDDLAAVDLFQVWVAPEARGRGVGAALIQQAVGWAGKRGSREVRLSVTCGDTPARRLYEREGFVAVGKPVACSTHEGRMEQNMRLALA